MTDFFRFYILIFFVANVQISQTDHHNFDWPKMPRISKRASLLKEYKAIAKSHAVKSFIHSCFYADDSFEDEFDDRIAAELEIFKSSWYMFLC